MLSQSQQFILSFPNHIRNAVLKSVTLKMSPNKTGSLIQQMCKSQHRNTSYMKTKGNMTPLTSRPPHTYSNHTRYQRKIPAANR